MHLWMIIFRWLIEVVPGSVRAFGLELAHECLSATCAAARHDLARPDVSRVGWMKVRPVLEEFSGPPGMPMFGISGGCRGVGAERLCPRKPDHILEYPARPPGAR